MAPSVFTVEWDQQRYETAVRRLYLPWWRGSQGSKMALGLMLSTVSLMAITGLLVASVWFLSRRWEVWQAVTATSVLAAIIMKAASTNFSKEIEQGWTTLRQMGPLRFELTDEALLVHLSTDSYTYMPWQNLELLSDNEHGLLIHRNDYNQPIIVPASVGDPALAALRAKLRRSVSQ